MGNLGANKKVTLRDQAFAWILLALLPFAGLHAEEAQGPAPQFDAACGDLKGYFGKTDKEIEALSNSTMRVRINYCKAAKSSLGNHTYSIASSITWGLMSAYCFTSCGLSKSVFPATAAAGTAMAPYCAWGAVGLGVADTTYQVIVASLAKEYTTAATSAATGLAGVGVTVATNVATKADPCAAGVTSSLQMAMAIIRSATSKAAAETNLKSAVTLIGDKGGITPNSTPTPNSATQLAGGAGGGSVGGISGSGDGSTARAAAAGDVIAQGVCDDAVRTGLYAPLVNCAKSGGEIPPALFQPEFAELFKKNMGQDVQTFLNNGADVASAVNSALTGPLGADTAGRLASTIRAQDDRARAELGKASGSMYAGGGGASRQGARASSAFPNIGDFMKDLMGGMPGAKKADTASADRGLARFGAANKGRPGVEEDPTVSLFDRVSVRYQEKTSSVSNGANDWSLPSNRAAHGIK